MLNILRQELSELSGKLHRKDKIESMLANLKHEEQRLVKKEHDLHKLLSKEYADVKRLEKTSVTSIFFSALGKKETRLEKEQQEAWATKLKYDAAVHQLDDCRNQIAYLLQERESFLDCEQRYKHVYDEILNLLKDNTAYGIDLCNIEKQLGEATSQLREISEAISAGNSCMSEIKYIEQSLDSTEGWGTWDLLGGGLISDLVKHDHLDDAQSGVEKLQSLLNRFRTELADIKINSQIKQVNVDGLLLFADYFFDGLIADWCVLSRINDSQQSVTKVKGELSTALSRLQSLYTIREQEKATLEQQIDMLVCGN